MQSERVATQVSRSLARLRRSSGVSLTFSGRSDGAGLRLSQFDGPVMGPLRDVGLDPGHGLGGRVLLERRPVAVHDYVRTPSIVHTYDAIIRAERLQAMVAAPVIVGRRLVAVLYAASRNAQDELGRVYDAVTAEARLLEQSLAVAEIVDQRHEEPATGFEWSQQAQGAFDELVDLAALVPDRDLRARIVEAVGRLSGGAHEASPASHQPFVPLTGRERDVLLLMSAGLPNREIAVKLGIGVHTVKDHVRGVLRKTGARTRLEAVVTAQRAGIS